MNTQVDLAGIIMKNPVMTASGTVGFGKEYSEFVNINRLGAFVPKTVTLEPKKGNPPERICETDSGMINSIGLQNKGVDYFIENELPFLYQFETPIIVNISANSIIDFVKLTEKFSNEKISGLEINVSCPNVEGEGMAFGTDEKATYDVVQAVKSKTTKPIIVKLTPNVTNIIKIAESAYKAGANALSMINTVLGMAIDVKTREPKIHGAGKYMGGLSGPCIKPIGVRYVYQVYKSVPLPIVGIGGIMNGNDAIEYILAGATAVGVGTANFIYPDAATKVIKGIEKYMQDNKIENINELRGNLKNI